MQLARVGVRVIVLVVDVVCVMLVLIARVVVQAVGRYTVFVASFLLWEMYSLHTPVGDSRLRWLLPN